jgi:hypothetical protein
MIRPMRRLTIALLGAWLVWAGTPAMAASACGTGGRWTAASGSAATQRHGANCRMACCKRGGARSLATAPASTTAPVQTTCRMGCGHGRQAGAAVPAMPWLLPPLPVRLTAPASGAFAGRHPRIAVAPPALDLPERPPRA